jgi:glycogen operon protein
MVTRLVGSPDLYGHEEREPEQSINFVTCHDGFTLYDLVSYEQKHNEANKENNKDGNDDNISWNSGKEGDTNDPSILQLRNRQVKNFFTLNLLSIGAPLISMGDEVCRTQFGNNNAYCQNNEISWFDWNLKDVHSDMFRFVRLLILGRLQRDSAQAEFAMSLNQLLKNAEISWHGVKLNQPDWSDQSHSISFTVKSMSRNLHTHFLINAWVEPLTFELPQLKEGRKWRSWIDTTKESPLDISSWNETTPISTDEYAIGSYSIAVLVAFQ